MDTTLRVVKSLSLLLYTALFVVSEWLFLRFGQRDPAVLVPDTMPLLWILLIASCGLALLLTVVERGSALLWGFLTHLQFILCYVPLVLNLIRTLQGVQPGAPLPLGAGFTFSFDGVLLAYCLLPLNAICVFAYYVWVPMSKPKAVVAV
jgi:hypothetical protein